MDILAGAASREQRDCAAVVARRRTLAPRRHLVHSAFQSAAACEFQDARLVPPTAPPKFDESHSISIAHAHRALLPWPR